MTDVRFATIDPLLGTCAEYHRLHTRSVSCDAACRAAGEEDEALEAAWLDARDLEDDVLDTVVAMVPITAAGLAAKALVIRSALRLDEAVEWRDQVAGSLVRDTQLFAERSA